MPTDIGLERLDDLLASGATLIEVLPAKEYDEEHLPGAINVPIKEIVAARIAELGLTGPTVVYCWDSL
jgi:rhodanese-related sulfurtransferase